MALTKINNYSNSDLNNLALQQSEDVSFIGKHQVSLTQMDTTTVPALAAGSIIEVNGSLLRCNTEQAITTTDPHTSATVADGVVYIMVDGTTLTQYFTATAPTWSDSKQGWYGVSTWANWRYVEFSVIKTAASYTDKTPAGYPVFYAAVSKTSFSAYHNTTAVSVPTSGFTKLPAATEYFDTRSDYDAANSKFTAPRAGVYNIQVVIGYFATGEGLTGYLFKNGAEYLNVNVNTIASGNAYSVVPINVLMNLNKGDYIEVYGSATTGTVEMTKMFFSGCII